MGIPIVGDIIDAVKDLASEVIVDKDKRNELNLRLEELRDRNNQRDFELSKAQTEVNKVEAGHASIFVAGWRPAVGWISAASVAYTFLLMPLMAFVARVVFGYKGEFPILETSQLMLLLGGMLGIAGFRTFEISKGVNRDSITGVRQGGKEPNATLAAPEPLVPPGFGDPNNNLPESAPWAR